MFNGEIAGKAVERLKSDYLPFAHHPHCQRHDNHLIWIRGHPYCLGCLCLYSGLVLGLALGLMVGPAQPDSVRWLLIHIPFAIPTLFQPWIQNKPFKVASRTALGLGMGSFVSSGLLFGVCDVALLFTRLFVLIVVPSGYAVLSYLRAKYTHDPCKDCPLGTYPVCEWNLPRLLNQNPNRMELTMFADESDGGTDSLPR